MHPSFRAASLSLAFLLAAVTFRAMAAPALGKFRGIDASPLTRSAAESINLAADNKGLPYFIVDKAGARLYVFNGQGQSLANAPVLLGLALGDDTVPGIGDRKISDILPFERTTPAGRFMGESGINASGDDIVWVDYDAAVSMHRVRSNVPQQRRLQRLASSTVADNRISYGCINVPVKFYDQFVKPVFDRGSAIIYVLPDSKSLSSVFGWPANAGARSPSQGRFGAAVDAVQNR